MAATVHLIPFALAPDADRFNTDPQTDWIKISGTGDLYFLVVEGAGGTGTAAITVESASDNSGTGNTAIAFQYKTVTSGADFDTAGGYSNATTSGVTPAAGATKSTLVKVRYDQVEAGKPWVSLILTESVDSPVDAAVIAFQTEPERPGSGNSVLS